MRVTRWFACACLVAIGGCGLLLEDLSSGGGDADGDAGGATSDGEPGHGDAQSPLEPLEAGLPDAPIVEDLDASTGASDADASWPFKLDCTGTVLCDGFEGRTTIPGAPVVGAWNDNALDSAAGTITLSTASPAAGQQCVTFSSLANPTASSRHLFFGAGELLYAKASPTIVADFDMHIYGYWPFDPGDRRNLVGMYLYSGNSGSDQEFAGISISNEKGLHAEINEYASAAATQRKGTPYRTFDLTKLTGGWHHVHLEATFATTTAGKLELSIDGALVAQIQSVITRTTNADRSKFVIWFGALASPGVPPLDVRYDNVEVRVP